MTSSDHVSVDDLLDVTQPLTDVGGLQNAPLVSHNGLPATDGISREKPTTDKQLNDFADFLEGMFSIGIQGYVREYKENLKTYVPPNLTHEAFDRNMEKNRYKDVICADASRVILRGFKNSYIHANFVTHPALKNKFICTQGPMVNTTADFWRMVWQEKVGVIVMLCEIVEHGMEKCAQYWPFNVGDKYVMSGIKIENVKADIMDNRQIINTTLRITVGTDVRTVSHYQWKNWPDGGVPQYTQCVFHVACEARKCVTVVHSSAGVGRTGSFVALEVCFQKLLNCEKLCITSTIQELRAQRNHLIQTDLQLLFICKALTVYSRAFKYFDYPELQAMQATFNANCDAYVENGVLPVEGSTQNVPIVPQRRGPVRYFVHKKRHVDNNRLRVSNRNTSREKPTTEKQKKHFIDFLVEMFNTGVEGYLRKYEENLRGYVPPDLTHEAFDGNMEKNRCKDVACADASRVILRGFENSYIHANYVTHPALKNKFICTQGPMANTTADFWRMVWQEKVGAIVMLCNTMEHEREKCIQYWPQKVGYVLRIAGIEIENLKIEYRLQVHLTKLCVKKGENVRMVNHYRMTDWPEQGVPQATAFAYHILNDARKCVTVVHCSAGVGRTGSFVALEVCLQKLLTGKKLCITSTIRELRAQRNHLVQTDLQLLFICNFLTYYCRYMKEFCTTELKVGQKRFIDSYKVYIEAHSGPVTGYTPYTPLVPIKGLMSHESTLTH